MRNLFIVGALLFCFLPGMIFGATLEQVEKQIIELRSDYEAKIAVLEKNLNELQHDSVTNSTSHSNTNVNWNKNLKLTTSDGNSSVTIKGRIQSRFEHEKEQNPANNSHTSFRLRRVRLEFNGQLKSQNLTFKIMPDLSRDANLRDAWINYHFDSGVQLRFGQFQVPLNLERNLSNSSSRQHFIERSVAGEDFLWSSGEDIGMMLHGLSGKKLAYSAGVYSGQGRNKKRSNSTGVVAAGRASYAISGDHPASETLIKPVEGSNILFGAGAYHADKNDARDWHPWSSGTVEKADLSAFTGDFTYQCGALSAHFSKFYRSIDPLNPGLNRYSGDGYNSQIGYLLKPEKVFSALRYSEGRPNREMDNGKTQEALFSTQLFFAGHNSKLSFELGRIRTHNGTEWHNTDISRMQYQLLF